ncbi:hypothetical protein C8R48DRAFT_783019 [Suillus tomentosus]|jgi:hypothetical protein|nr:hypothetical protein C8R48DRAFT_783016 [Suillus tomentosus]KAG1836063.1 hypothetical protein C8R48DRAFT_783019 [Suillus tomentosus]
MYQQIALFDEDNIQQFLACLRLRPMHVEFAQTAITSLYIDGMVNASTVLDILSLCSGVKYLALMVDIYPDIEDHSPIWRALDHLPLASLALYGGVHFINSISTFRRLKHITHLDLIDSGVVMKSNTGLHSLDNLTFNPPLSVA